MVVGDGRKAGDEQPPAIAGGIIQSEIVANLVIFSSWMTNMASENEKTATMPPDSATWILPRLLKSLPVLPKDFIFRIKRGKIRYAG